MINAGKEYSLCDKCIKELDWANKNTCEKCGIKLENDEIHLCKTCMQQDQNFEKAYTCMVYDEMAKNMITEYKFRGKAYMAKPLAEILIDKFLTSGAVADMVTFVPMHPKKEKQRGYNQAKLLAESFAVKLELPLESDLLLRKVYKKAMNKLGASERRENIQGAYALTCDEMKLEKLKGKTVILIDDIYTTGTTANECAKLLKDGGAESVSVFTLAAGADN